MASQIEISMTTLDQDINSMSTLLNQIRTNMNGMFDSIQELDAMWDGPAHQAFAEQVTADKALMVTLCNTVQEIIESMENAKTSYRQCESAVADVVNQIEI
jgi:WXG100 family type VII secretion target